MTSKHRRRACCWALKGNGLKQCTIAKKRYCLACGSYTAPHSYKHFEIFSILWRGKLWPICGMVFSIGIAALFLSLATPRYLAISQILINPANSRIIEKGDNAIPRQYDPPEIQIESQTLVLTSEILLRRVADKLLLDQDPNFARSRLDAMMESFAEKTGYHVSRGGN